MALNAQYSNAAVNAAVDAMATLLNSGYLRLYTTPQAADANTALGAQTLLAELRFGFTGPAGAVFGTATMALPALTSEAVGGITIPVPVRPGPAWGVIKKQEKRKRRTVGTISVTGRVAAKLAPVQAAARGMVTLPSPKPVKPAKRIEQPKWAEAPIVARAKPPKRIKRPEPAWVGNRVPEPEPWQPAKVTNVTDEEEELLLALL